MAHHTQTIETRATFITLMLREDHQKIRQLFEQIDNTTMTTKREIVRETLTVLEEIGRASCRERVCLAV